MSVRKFVLETLTLTPFTAVNVLLHTSNGCEICKFVDQTKKIVKLKELCLHVTDAEKSNNNC